MKMGISPSNERKDMEETESKMLTPTELADRWKIHEMTLGNWRSQKRGPKYVKLGDSRNAPVLYRLEDVIEYEEKYIVKTGT